MPAAPAIIMGAAAIGGAAISANSASKASKAGQRASENELQYLQNRDLQARSDNQPYRESGYNALNALNSMTGQERQLSGEQSDEIDSLWSDFDKDGTYGLTALQQKSVDQAGQLAEDNWKFGYDLTGGILFGRQGAGKEARNELTAKYENENKLAYGETNKEDFYAEKKAEMLGDPYEWQADPGYQFRLQEGNKALQQRQSAQGSYLSGASTHEAIDYNQGAAASEFANIFGRLSMIAGYGPGAIQASQGQGGGGQAIASGGAYQAAGTVAQGNAWGTAVNQIGAAAGAASTSGFWGAAPPSNSSPTSDSVSDYYGLPRV